MIPSDLLKSNIESIDTTSLVQEYQRRQNLLNGLIETIRNQMKWQDMENISQLMERCEAINDEVTLIQSELKKRPNIL